MVPPCALVTSSDLFISVTELPSLRNKLENKILSFEHSVAFRTSADCARCAYAMLLLDLTLLFASSEQALLSLPRLQPNGKWLSIRESKCECLSLSFSILVRLLLLIKLLSWLIHECTVFSYYTEISEAEAKGNYTYDTYMLFVMLFVFCNYTIWLFLLLPLLLLLLLLFVAMGVE